MDFENLPEGWELTELGNLGKWSSGGTPSRKESKYYGGNIPWIKTGDLSDGFIFKVDETITEEGLRNSSAKIFPENSILIAMYGATIGKLGILKLPAATNQACAALIAKGLTSDLISYTFYYLLNIREDLRDIGKGGAQPNISQTIIKEFSIPLPPLNEQRRIVTKIEELNAHTRKAREALEEVPQLIEQFRRSLLAAAFRGDLTADWRKKNPDIEPASELLESIKIDLNKKKIIKINESQLPTLPPQWCWASLDSVSKHKSGVAFKSKKFVDKGIQVIRLGNVYKGVLNLDREPVFLPNTFLDETFTLNPRDIVVSQTGTRFKRDYGNFVVIPANSPKLFLNQRLLAISCHQSINPEYVAFASKLPSKHSGKGVDKKQRIGNVEE